MLNLLSVLTGLVALALALVGLLPLLGWLNWLTIPVAVIGAALGIVSARRTGRNLNLFVLVVAAIRLVLGAGIL